MITNIPCPACRELAEFSYSKKLSKYRCAECDEVFDALPKGLIDVQTIFLSYAHNSDNPEDYDSSEELVWLIKEELEKDGHAVWIDRDGIRAGTHWREIITDAITSHTHFLAFLSNRSVRQAPNVCINEVNIAIKHNRIIQTILTESEELVSAPLTLSSIQWHNFQGWKQIREGQRTGILGEDWSTWFDNLMAQIRQNLADISHQKAVGELSELKAILNPTSFVGAIINGVEGFFGRKWLFEATDEWLKTDKRLFWLKGSPGIGKSSFAAKLVHSGNSSIVGFFKCDFQVLKSVHESASECIRTLAYQLASRLPDYRIKLLRDQRIDFETVQKKTADDLFTYLITEPLNRSEKIAESQRLALVIDALDEAGKLDNGKMVNPLADLLYKHADQLPPWLGIIITSRPEAYLQQQLGAKFAPLIVQGGTQNNIEDIKNYLESTLDLSIAGESREKTIQSIIDKSGGTFLYIKRVELGYDISKPDDLPEGLDDLFYKDFERYFPDIKQYEEKTEKFLRLLVAAPGPLPKRLAQELLQWQTRDFTKFITQPMASLLIQSEGGVQFFHKSIKDWLQDSARSGIYQVNETGAKELADFLWKEFEKGQPQENGKVLEERGEGSLGSVSVMRRDRAEKIERVASEWEVQLKEWLTQLLPSINQWQQRKALKRFASYLHANLKYQDELALEQQHLKLTEEKFGEGEETAVSLYQLGHLVETMGLFHECESLLRKSLDMAEKSLGLANPITLRTMNTLAFLLGVRLERYEEAEALSKKGIQITESSLGADHEDTGRALIVFSGILCDLGKYEEAVVHIRRAIDILNKTVGKDHRTTAQAYNLMGIVFSYLLKNEEAIATHKYALSIRKNILGNDHPDVAMSMNNIAYVLMKQEHYKEAERYILESLEIRERSLGHWHHFTASSYGNLGNLLIKLGQTHEAEAPLLKCLDIRKKALGENHSLYKGTKKDLFDLYTSCEKYEEASKYKTEV